MATCTVDSRQQAFYSQFGEDRWMSDHCALPPQGVFVDVGAFHSKCLSNTYWLEQRGWDGICIEPDPRCLSELMSYRKRVIPLAVSCIEGQRQFHLSPDVGFSGLKSANGNGSIYLTAERLDTILQREQIADVDVLSIDTEGTELDVLKSLGTIRPHYIIVEHVTCGQNHREELLTHLTPDYYVLHETACNLILRRRADVDRELIGRLTPQADVEKLLAKHERPIHQSVLAVQSVPRYGTNSHADCLFAMTYALGIRTNRNQGVFWDQCLTRAMSQAISTGYEFLLAIDHDTIFSPDDVQELWRIMKADPSVDALCGCQVARERCQPLMLHTDSSGMYWERITPEEIVSEKVRLKSAHFGLTLLRCSSFAKMKKPWFMPVPDANGEWEAGHVDSDIAFWSNWWDCGNTLWQANHVVVGHAQEMISWPDSKLHPVHQYLSDYAANGRPKDSLNYKETNRG